MTLTSCKCEHSANTIRRLHTYVRASMGQERLSSLTLLHIHYDNKINQDGAVKIYRQMHPRRMELDSLIKPSRGKTLNMPLFNIFPHDGYLHSSSNSVTVWMKVVLVLYHNPYGPSFLPFTRVPLVLELSNILAMVTPRVKYHSRLGKGRYLVSWARAARESGCNILPSDTLL